MVDVNAIGTMNGTVAALERMTEAGSGHVINVVSLAGIVAAPGEVAYSASKHAALAFTLGTLFDLRRSGVRDIELSAVCPDGIWTPMLEGKLDDPDAAGSFSGRLLTPGAGRDRRRQAHRPAQAAAGPAPLARAAAALRRRLPASRDQAPAADHERRPPAPAALQKTHRVRKVALTDLGRTLRKTPTTLPKMRASVVRIGSIVSFSGWSRTWSASR